MSVGLTAFAWEGRDSLGASRRGVQTAPSKADALRSLQAPPDPITVTFISQSITERWSLATAIAAVQHHLQESGVHAARLGFYRLAARFLKRGTHVRDAVAQYLLECPSPRFKAVLRDVLQRTGAEGMSFPDALALHPVEFPRQHVEMLRIPFKQKASALPTFERLRNMDTALRKRAARDFVGRLNFYFSYVLSAGGAIYVAYYYLPNLQRWIEIARIQAQIPPAVLALAAAGHFMTSPWGVAIVGAAVVGLRQVWRSAMATRKFRLLVERSLWGIPSLGTKLRWAQLLDDRALALNYLASMRFTGVGEKLALELTSDAVQSVQFSDGLLRQAERVGEDGLAFSESFASEALLWGGEVVALVGPAKDDFIPVATELAADFDEEAQAASAQISAIKNFGHLAAATLLAGLITGTIYLSSLAVTQAMAHQH